MPTMTVTAPNVFTDEEVYEGMLAKVRPYYHVPGGRGCLNSARSPYTYEVQVVERSGEMWLVEHTWETDAAPWKRRQAYYARELHKTYNQCPCAACTGDGIHEHRGA